MVGDVCANAFPSSTAPTAKIVRKTFKGFLMRLLSHWRKNSANRIGQQPLASTHHIHDATFPISGAQPFLLIRGCLFTARLYWRNRAHSERGLCSGPVAYAIAIRFAYSGLYSDTVAHSDGHTGVPDKNSPQPNSDSNLNAHADPYARIYAEYEHNSLAYTDTRANVRSSFESLTSVKRTDAFFF